MKVSSTSDRVTNQTPSEINERIQRATEASIEYHKNHPELIERRLQELDEEWDIERTLQTNAASLVLGGSLLGLVVNRLFWTVPIAVSGFLLQHSIQGWCPPLKLLRRSGCRTAREIETDRYALQASKSNGKASEQEKTHGNGRQSIEASAEPQPP